MKNVWIFSLLLSAWAVSGALAFGQTPSHNTVINKATSKASAEKSELKALDLKGLRTFLAKYGAVRGGQRIGLYQSRAGSWPQNIAAGLSHQLRAAGFTVCRL
ncbi:MAG: hypothetical protein ACP5VQ_11450, partial [Phycisphaerae bacterium]